MGRAPRVRTPVNQPPLDGTLRFSFTRRGLLSEASTWLKVAAEATPERPARRLIDLGVMADAELAAIRPRVAPGCTISVEHGRVLARPAGTGDAIPIMATTGPSLTVFNAANGMTTVAQMAARVAAETGWDDAEAFAFCRKAILRLVGLRVCIPADRD